MAKLPAAMRRKRAAITSIHEKPLSPKQKMANFGGWLLLVVAMLSCMVGAYAFYQVMTEAKIAELKVIGARNAAEHRQLIAHVGPVVQDNYFTSDLPEIRDKALELSWVDRVVVSRAWPNSIKLRVMPRHAIARWGTGRLLSDSGDIFTEVQASQVQHLPLLHGPTTHAKMMMRRYHEINALFLPTNLRLKELYLTERMTWFMQFDNGLRVMVDKDQTMSKLQRLSHLAHRDLKPVWSKIAAIDLRYRNGMAIQWKNATAPQIVNGHFVVTSSDAGLAQQNQQQP